MKSTKPAIITVIIGTIAISVSIAVIFSMQSSAISGINTASASPTASIAADNASSLLFTRDSRPYNMSYEEWAAEWWRFFAAIPEVNSPAADPIGEKCSINQNNDHVWFLVGAFQGKVNRTCEVPADKALIGAFIGIECNEKQDGPVGTLTECAEEGPKYLRLARLTIDGIEIPNVEDYKVTSPPSNMSFPEGAVWGAPAGNYALVGSGIMPIIKPLPVGNHTIAFVGIIDHPINPAYDVAVDVTYNLIVKEAPNA
jgi:hypothetical protein